MAMFLYILLYRNKSTNVWKMRIIQYTVKMQGFSTFYGEIGVDFCLNTRKRFFLEVSF